MANVGHVGKGDNKGREESAPRMVARRPERASGARTRAAGWGMGPKGAIDGPLR